MAAQIVPTSNVGAATAVAETRPATRARASATGESGRADGARPIDTGAVVTALEQTGREFVLDGRTIEFSFDESAGRIIVKVRSEESGELIRQIPPEEYLTFSAKLREQLGVLFDEIF